MLELNVGGTIYTTSEATLLGTGPHASGFLNGLLASGMETTRDADGRRFIDRNGAAFAPVLEYLRHGNLVLPAGVTRAMARIEAEFYLVDGLVQLIDKLEEEERLVAEAKQASENKDPREVDTLRMRDEGCYVDEENRMAIDFRPVKDEVGYGTVRVMQLDSASSGGAWENLACLKRTESRPAFFMEADNIPIVDAYARFIAQNLKRGIYRPSETGNALSVQVRQGARRELYIVLGRSTLMRLRTDDEAQSTRSRRQFTKLVFRANTCIPPAIAEAPRDPRDDELPIDVPDE